MAVPCLSTTPLISTKCQLTRPETKNFIYFYIGPIAVLLWKTS